MGEPTSIEEYQARLHENTKVTGQGIEGTRLHLPCPFCAAPEFLAFPILDQERMLRAGAVCRECGRGMRAVYERPNEALTRFYLVQTEGPPPAAWCPVRRREGDPPPSDPQVTGD
jgi:hypothetical protein